MKNHLPIFTKREEISSFKVVINQINKEDSTRKESPLFAKAMMIGLNLSEDEVISEFIRASDAIRLEFDELFAEYLINLAKKKELTQEITSMMAQDMGNAI